MRNLYLLACLRVGCPGGYFVKNAKLNITFSLLLTRTLPILETSFMGNEFSKYLLSITLKIHNNNKQWIVTVRSVFSTHRCGLGYTFSDSGDETGQISVHNVHTWLTAKINLQQICHWAKEKLIFHVGVYSSKFGAGYIIA